MTTKSQLNACRDSLMAGMRAATRGATPDEQAGLVLRACLDLVEHSIARDAASVTPSEVSTRTVFVPGVPTGVAQVSSFGVVTITLVQGTRSTNPSVSAAQLVV